MTESNAALNRPLKEAFSLGSWRVDPDLNQLSTITNCHYRRALEPRIMHLLCFLAANSGRTLSRDELTRELWPRVIVNDNSLTRAVSELRKQLTTTERAVTDFLQTVPKKGYRLSCPIEVLTGPPSASSLIAATENSISTRTQFFLPWRRPVQVAAGLLLAILLIRQEYPLHPSAVSEISQNGFMHDQVIDTDPGIFGAQLTLSAFGDRTPRDAGTVFNNSAALKPDGTMLAFLRQQGNEATIYLMGAGEGVPADPLAIYSTEGYIYNLTWSPVGNALLFAKQGSVLQPAHLDLSSRRADLVMLDLDTLSLKILINRDTETRNPAEV